MLIDLAGELQRWLPTARAFFKDVIREAVREVLAEENERLMTLAEAADYLQISDNALRKRAAAGKVTAIRNGRSLRFRRRDLVLPRG